MKLGENALCDANCMHVDVYGHTTLKTPVLVRSPKLRNVGRDRLGTPCVVDAFCFTMLERRSGI